MQLVDQALLEILPDRRYTASDSDIAATRGGSRLLERGACPFGDELKLGIALHSERRPRMMREHEHGHVVGRLLAPPAPPALIRPRPAHGTEHVAPQNPGSDSGEAGFGHSVVDA